jgi:hypothetical protein
MATTASGYPYPVGTDRVMDGDDAIHALADAIEAKLRTSAAGQATSGAAVVGVTLPVGRFLTAPAVVGTANTSTMTGLLVNITSITTTSFDLAIRSRIDGTFQAGIVTSWVAMGKG